MCGMSMFAVGVTNVGCRYSLRQPRIAVTNVCHCYNVTTCREAKWRVTEECWLSGPEKGRFLEPGVVALKRGVL
jgi:hypothetical protein